MGVLHDRKFELPLSHLLLLWLIFYSQKKGLPVDFHFLPRTVIFVVFVHAHTPHLYHSVHCGSILCQQVAPIPRLALESQDV